MHISSLFLFIVVLVIALNTLPEFGRATTAVTQTSTKVAAIVRTPVRKPGIASRIQRKKKKKKNKQGKQRKKSKQSPWKIPDVDQQKLFNHYKPILRAKLTSPPLNIIPTYPLEPTKYSSQTVDNKNLLHHYLVKLPDSKYAHVVIGTKNSSTSINETNISIHRRIYNTLAAAEN